MPVLGLVLMLDDGSEATRSRVADALAGARDLELGLAQGHRWPVVLESPTNDLVEARVNALREIGGVAGVDVVYADFEDLLMREAPASTREVT
jgi:nitrate reductase NapAB chaperone NapD